MTPEETVLWESGAKPGRMENMASMDWRAKEGSEARAANADHTGSRANEENREMPAEGDSMANRANRGQEVLLGKTKLTVRKEALLLAAQKDRPGKLEPPVYRACME